MTIGNISAIEEYLVKSGDLIKALSEATELAKNTNNYWVSQNDPVDIAWWVKGRRHESTNEHLMSAIGQAVPDCLAELAEEARKIILGRLEWQRKRARTQAYAFLKETKEPWT